MLVPVHVHEFGYMLINVHYIINYVCMLVIVRYVSVYSRVYAGFCMLVSVCWCLYVYAGVCMLIITC